MKQQTKTTKPKSATQPIVAQSASTQRVAAAAPATSSRGRIWLMQVVYLAVSGFLLLIILQLPQNKAWLDGAIHNFYGQRRELGRQTDLEIRKQTGWGTTYAYTNFIRQQCKPADYFLIPPQRYLIRNAYTAGAADGYAWVHPSIMYYHLGGHVHLLEMTAPDSLLRRATHTFWAQSSQLSFLPLTEQNRALVFSEFRKYDPHFFAFSPQQAQAYYDQKP